jgi:cytidine deaminase
MTDRRKQFEAILSEFPQDVRPILRSIPDRSGRLSADRCAQVQRKTGMGVEALMLRLLPLAQCFAAAPVSGFAVGAVAMAAREKNTDRIELYPGANIEFLHLPLYHSIHAEQAAVLNAWHQGAVQVRALAVSHTPCGHCRQFLTELEPASTLPIIRPIEADPEFERIPLSQLLPDAFGPRDLGRRPALMDGRPPAHPFTVKARAGDRVLAAAIAAARQSYAPYSGNLAGCALQTPGGAVYSGRTVESAAFNPGLTALQSAIGRLNLTFLEAKPSITRAVLVEKPTAVSQRRAAELLLAAWGPQVELEYFEAEGIEDDDG